MMAPNPIEGIGLHAIGATSASTCYLPFHKTRKWSWVSYWLVQSLFAWILTPLVLALLTIPGFFGIIHDAPSRVLWLTFLFGAIYGFGGMSFGFATRYIGYSLTYAISIGISAVLGTILPLLMKGTIGLYFRQPGGQTIAIGMIIAIIGVGLCGWAGFKKEQEIKDQTKAAGRQTFNMRTGLFLAIAAGVLSGIFNIALEYGQPVSDMAAQKGAGIFEGNAKLIIATSGCFVVNFIWFSILGMREKRFKEFAANHYSEQPEAGSGQKTTSRGTVQLVKNLLWSAFGGILWCMQFFFYGLGHVKMGKLQFASWVIHMSMLIFFSFLVGLAMKEWKNVSKKTYATLITALITLALSFVIMSYAGM